MFYVLSGIPGSGKSHEARRLAATGALVVSADNHPGLYDAQGGFHVELLSAAHRACFRQAVEGVQAGLVVVVDNTNLSAIDAAPYVALGRAFDREVEIVRVECDQAVAFARQTHGVPEVTHRRMAEAFAAFAAPPSWEVVVRTVR